MQTIQVAVKPDKKEIWLGMNYTTAGYLLKLTAKARDKEAHPERRKLAQMICHALENGFEQAIERTEGVEPERN